MADDLYPGELATAQQLHALAEEYRRASHVLLSLGRRGKPLTRAPFRLAAIHAIELYLNAFLLQCGHEAGRIRGLQHDMSARTRLALLGGLSLRKRTVDHLHALGLSREYLITRYGPEFSSTVSQVNRLTATLEEVAKKVTTVLAVSTVIAGSAKSSP